MSPLLSGEFSRKQGICDALEQVQALAPVKFGLLNITASNFKGRVLISSGKSVTGAISELHGGKAKFKAEQALQKMLALSQGKFSYDKASVKEISSLNQDTMINIADFLRNPAQLLDDLLAQEENSALFDSQDSGSWLTLDSDAEAEPALSKPEMPPPAKLKDDPKAEEESEKSSDQPAVSFSPTIAPLQTKSFAVPDLSDSLNPMVPPSAPPRGEAPGFLAKLNESVPPGEQVDEQTLERARQVLERAKERAKQLKEEGAGDQIEKAKDTLQKAQDKARDHIKKLEQAEGAKLTDRIANARQSAEQPKLAEPSGGSSEAKPGEAKIDRLQQVINDARKAEELKEQEKSKRADRLQKAIEDARRAAEAAELEEAKRAEQSKLVLEEAKRLEEAQHIEEATELLEKAQQQEEERQLEQSKEIEEANRLLAEAMKLEEDRKQEEAKELLKAQQLLDEAMRFEDSKRAANQSSAGSGSVADESVKDRYRQEAEALKRAILDAMQLEETQVREKAKQLEEANALLGKARSLSRSRGLDIANKLDQSRKLEESNRAEELKKQVDSQQLQKAEELSRSRSRDISDKLEKEIKKGRTDRPLTSDAEIEKIIGAGKDKSVDQTSTSSYKSLKKKTQGDSLSGIHHKLVQMMPLPKDTNIPKWVVPAVIGVVVLIGVGCVGSQAYLISQAESHFARAEYKEALSAANQAMVFSGGNSHLHALRGAILAKDPKRLDDAFKDYSVALTAEPSNPSYLREHASVASQAGKYTQAKSDLDQLLAHNPDPKEQAVVLAQRGGIQMKLGNLKAADADFTKSIELGRKRPPLYLGRGEVRLALKEPRLAMDDFNAAMAANPGDQDKAWALVGKAQAYRDLNDPKTAITFYDDAIKTQPKGSEYYLRRGMFFSSQNKDKQALDDFDSAISFGKQLEAPYIEKATIQAKQSKYSDALGVLNSAIKNCGATAKLTIARAKIYKQQGDFKNAVADFNKALGDDSKDVDSYVDLAYCNSQIKDYKSAIQAIEQALAVRPKDSNLIALHAHYNALFGNAITAKADFEKAFKADSKNAQTYLWHGEFLFAQSEYWFAKTEIERSLALDPKLPGAHQKLVEVNKFIKDKNIAASKTPGQAGSAGSTDTDTLLNQPVKGDFQTLLTTGYAKLQSNDAAGAIRYLAGAVRLNTNDAQARRYLAHAFLLRDDTANAISQLQILVRLPGATEDDLRNLGSLFIQANRPEEAVKMFIRCLKINPGDVESRCKLAQSFAAAGNMRKAVDTCVEGIKTDPSHEGQYADELKRLGSRDKANPAPNPNGPSGEVPSG